MYNIVIIFIKKRGEIMNQNRKRRIAKKLFYEMEAFAEIEAVSKESDIETENKLKTERINTVMKEIIRQKNIDIPQTVVNMIICKIQLNNYKIYNIYRYVMKCIENYLTYLPSKERLKEEIERQKKIFIYSIQI